MSNPPQRNEDGEASWVYLLPASSIPETLPFVLSSFFWTLDIHVRDISILNLVFLLLFDFWTFILPGVFHPFLRRFRSHPFSPLHRSWATLTSAV